MAMFGQVPWRAVPFTPVELILLPGILDIDGQLLEPRPDHDPGGAVDVLRFQVAGTRLSGSSR